MSSTCSFTTSSSRKPKLTNLESKIDSQTIAEATALCFSIFDLERSTSRKFYYTLCSAALSISFVAFSKGQSGNQSRFSIFSINLRDFSRVPQKAALLNKFLHPFAQIKSQLRTIRMHFKSENRFYCCHFTPTDVDALCQVNSINAIKRKASLCSPNSIARLLEVVFSDANFGLSRCCCFYF